MKTRYEFITDARIKYKGEHQYSHNSLFFSAKIGLAKAVDDDSSVYVVMLGISSNTESVIKYGYGGFDLARVDTPELLSPDETR